MSMEKQLRGLKIANLESNRVTKEALQQALLTLMAKKPIEEISISELVSLSGVSRSAYYRNYNSKEDILADFSANVIDLINYSLKMIDINNNPLYWFKELFSYLKQNRKLLKLLIDANLIHLLDFTLAIKTDDSIINSYKLRSYNAGFQELIRCWGENNCKESINQMSQIAFDLFGTLHVDIIAKFQDTK